MKNVQVSHLQKDNAKQFSSVTKLWKEMGNVRKREKEFCPISKGALLAFLGNLAQLGKGMTSLKP